MKRAITSLGTEWILLPLPCLRLPVTSVILDYFVQSQAASASLGLSTIVTFPRGYVIVRAFCKILAAMLTLDLRVPAFVPGIPESRAWCRRRSCRGSSAAIWLIFLHRASGCKQQVGSIACPRSS